MTGEPARAICVFCGSSRGVNPVYAEVAHAVGSEIARRGWTLVYGGARVGLMGEVAKSALGAGGRVVGVMPRFLFEREVGHEGITSLEIVDSLAERKRRMGELSDAFLSLPGGIAVSHGPGGLKVTYGSGLDVLRQTPEFAAETIRTRLDGEFGGAYRYYEVLFGGRDPYMEAIERNLEYLRAVLKSQRWSLLRREPPCFTWEKNALQNMRTLVIQHLKAAMAAA